jgi:hypothetical protein
MERSLWYSNKNCSKYAVSPFLMLFTLHAASFPSRAFLVCPTVATVGKWFQLLLKHRQEPTLQANRNVKHNVCSFIEQTKPLGYHQTRTTSTCRESWCLIWAF